MKWTLRLLLLLTVGAILIATGTGIHRSAKKVKGDASSTKFPADKNQRLVFASGIVEGAHRDVHLQFEIEGRLQIILAREGRHVRNGDSLARLESNLWSQKLKAANAKLAYAQAERERLLNAARNETIQVARAHVESAEIKARQLKDKFERTQKLLTEKVVSRETHDSVLYDYQFAIAELKRAKAAVAETEAPARMDEVKMADAQIAIASAEVQQAQSMLEKTILKAPRDGTILRVLGEPGQLIGPETDRPLVTMADLDELRIRAYVEERDALSVNIGQEAFVTTDSKPNIRYAGSIISCTPFMTSKHIFHSKPGERLDVKTREIVIKLENADDLVVGLPVDVFIDPNSSVSPSNKRIPESLTPVSTSSESSGQNTEKDTVSPNSKSSQ